MTRPTIVEAALNGPWGKARQPGAPILVEDVVTDGIACAAAGASIIHVHAFDPDTGRQNDDAETYARIVGGIRERFPDVSVYPTVPLLGSGLTGEASSAQARYAHVEELAARGLIDIAVVDPGSVNFTDLRRGEPGFIYMNPEEHVLRGLDVCVAGGVRPSFAIYEPGFTRAGAALASRFGRLKTPIYRFMFSDGFAWGFPPREFGLDAHLALLGDTAAGAPWMVAGLDVDMLPLVAATVRRGGHVRVGLEDAPLGTARGNAEWVEAAIGAIETAGGRPATPGEASAILAASDKNQVAASS